MSNRVTIEQTIFQNVKSGEKTYGVRVYDDYAQAYDNTWGEIPDNDMDVLKKVLESDANDISAIMDNVRENENGVFIGGTWYDYDEIKTYVEEIA